MNKVYLIGNASKDCELETKGETKFARINLAVARKFDKDKTDWFNCVVFGALAEKVAVPYIKKGSKVAIIGRVEFSEQEKEDGTKIKHHSVVVEDIELLGNKSEQKEDNSKLEPINDDGLPF